MKLCQTKVEEWLAAALQTTAAELKIPIYTASETDDATKRPCIYISATTMQPTEGTIWVDNERTVDAIISVESPSSDSLPKHLAKCIEVESALSVVPDVCDFAGDIADFYAYDYNVTRTEKANADEVRFLEISLTARVRDDNGTGV